MDFTIISPNLNTARYITECLESVKSQTGITLEHIVVDGGSTDESEQIVARYPHARWIPGPDKGMSDGINKGFAQAQGDWVMWLNTDDRLKPGALKAVKDFAANSRADVLYGSFDFITGDGAFMRRIKMLPWSRFISVHHCCYIPSTAAFYRRSTVIVPGYRLRDDFRYVMDGEFYARLDAEGLSFDVMPSVLADFRLHEDNASMRYLKGTRDLDLILKAERQHVESRAVRRAYGITPFEDPYLNGLSDGFLWLAAKGLKGVRKLFIPSPQPPAPDR